MLATIISHISAQIATVQRGLHTDRMLVIIISHIKQDSTGPFKFYPKPAIIQCGSTHRMSAVHKIHLFVKTTECMHYADKLYFYLSNHYDVD